MASLTKSLVNPAVSAGGAAVKKLVEKSLQSDLPCPASLYRSVKVPEDLSEVTTTDAAEETDPAAGGMTAQQKANIWEAVEGLYKTGMHPAVSFVLRRNGKVILNRSIGHARGNGPGDAPDEEKLLATPDTPICLFSMSKAVTAVCVHKLVEDGLVHLNDPIKEYIPDFMGPGKENTTILHVLSHRAGVPGVPTGVPPEKLYDFDGCVDMLCEHEVAQLRGRNQTAYHAITGGFLLGAVVKATTGMDIRAYFDQKFAAPLGLSSFTYGIAPKDRDKGAKNYFTGLPIVFPLTAYIQHSLSASWEEVVEVSNTESFYDAVIPAGNMHATADEIGRFFEMLLNEGELDGVRVLKPLTVRRARTETHGQKIDQTLFLPMRYSAGFMLGNDPFGMFGPYSRQAFGHWGFINSFAWADPQRGVSAALLNTGKPLLGPHLPAHLKLLIALSGNCPNV